MSIQIRNGWVYTEEFTFQKGNLYVEKDRIREFSHAKEKAETVIDAAGCYVIPGLIDLHLHGCCGVDFSEGCVLSIEKMLTYEREHGITAICPATMTLPVEQLEKVCIATREFHKMADGGLVGINLEGPYLSREKCGAQNAEFVRKPDYQEFQRLDALSGGWIRIVTVAPELEGAFAFIEKASKKAVVSIGHSNAVYAEAERAFQSGARQVTHLYNGMRQWNHREPGIPGAASEHEKVMVELICDGYHLHSSVVRSAFRQYGKDRILLISDSTMAAGMPDGAYTLGGDAVMAKGRKVMLQDGTLAGSASNLLDCLNVCVKETGIPLEMAVQCATYNPAKVLNLQKDCGSLSYGKYADIVILDSELNLIYVIYRGKQII